MGISLKNMFRRKPKQETQMITVDENAATMLDMGSLSGYRFSIEYLMGLDPHQLKVRALQVLWRSVVAQGALRQLNVLTVNTGLRLQSMPSKFAIGADSEQASAYANDIEAYFNFIRQNKGCSFDKVHNFDELVILARWSWDIFGEYFAIFRYGQDPVVPVSVQLINPLIVKSPPMNSRPTKFVKIQDGIEFKNSKPVAFWIEESLDNNTTKWRRIPFRGRNSGNIIGVHHFDSKIVGDYRGTPKLAPVFHELERIQAALKYEIDSMASNASIAMVIERKETVTNPEKIKAAFSGNGDLRNTTVGQIDSTKVTTDRGGHIIQNGEPGETFKELNTQRPNVNMTEFVKSMIDIIGPAIGISRELMLMLFGKAYSASKGGIDLSFKNFDQDNFRFSSGFNQKYLEASVGYAVGQGILNLPGWGDPVKRAGYLVSKWLGIPKPSLNPLQEEKAATERVNNWRSTFEREAQLSTGTSFDVVADRQAVERQKIGDVIADTSPEVEEEPVDDMDEADGLR